MRLVEQNHDVDSGCPVGEGSWAPHKRLGFTFALLRQVLNYHPPWYGSYSPFGLYYLLWKLHSPKKYLSFSSILVWTLSDGHKKNVEKDNKLN